MFKICTHQLRRSFTTPRIYIAFMIGIVLQIISVIPILEFSQYLNKPLSVFEGFVYFTCDDYLMAACFLGIVVLVADAPFAEKNEIYTLLRSSRKKWIWGKVLYLLCICFIYYCIIAISGILFISSDAYLENVWSDPIYALVQNSGSEIATIYGVYFPYKHIYLNLTPALAMVISLTLSVLYSFVMSVFFFCINLKLSHVLSYVTVMMIHVAGYILLSLFYSYGYIKFSLFGNSLLMYHNINDYFDKGLFHTFFQSCLIYIIIAAVLIFLIIKAIQTYDFNNSGGIRP